VRVCTATRRTRWHFAHARAQFGGPCLL
jgi:hypothetical protein